MKQNNWTTSYTQNESERARETIDLTGKCDWKRDRKCSNWRMCRRFAAVLRERDGSLFLSLCRAGRREPRERDWGCRTLTQTIMCRSSVAVQFGIQLFILAVHFYSFRVEVNGVVKISFSVFVISFVFVNLCNCYRAANRNTFSVFINIVSFVLSLQFFQ